jgi:nucleotide-binding universal stress UspA family protein/hemerythrin-like domain-containing protein
MYQHLLVPIDDSPLSTATVTNAVSFARSQGARVSFFHAAPDLAATGDGALLHSLDSAAFAEASSAQGQSGLLQARTVAEMAGVSCETITHITDHPARAIYEAALAQGCDLIFMSSHGRAAGLRGWRGWLRGSVTQGVLQRTSVPVLVHCVETNQVDINMQLALSIIGAEHHSMAAVLRGMEHIVREARMTGQPLDTPLMTQLIRYMQTFPETQHCTKEEAYVFRLLRQRSSAYEPLLLELERQHKQQAALLATLDAAVEQHDVAHPSSLDRVSETLQRLAGAAWEHMKLEDTQVFPAARLHLTPDDWELVAMAFSAHVDPLLEIDEDLPLEQAFARIATALLAAPAAPGQPPIPAM